MKDCAKKCYTTGDLCQNKDCRMWIEHKDDNNCVMISIEKNGEMTLHQIADRLGISYVRVKQIQDKAISKLGKRLLVIE
tara:strand:- start:119 stop:355 length:237 start_codon:yes stop_codon:yes gene_type:complete